MSLHNDKNNEQNFNDSNDLNESTEGGRLNPPASPESASGGRWRAGDLNGLKWYVVQSKPREEERALHFLQEKGFETYLPRMEVVSARKFNNTTMEKPLFPGYLFCRFKKEDEILAQVRWTQGVKNLLPESANPMAVEDEVVQAIHSLEQEDGVIRKQPLEKNDRIRISRGPMKDILGVFEHWASDSGRVKVLLNFISYQATVELHHSLVEKVA